MRRKTKEIIKDSGYPKSFILKLRSALRLHAEEEAEKEAAEAMSMDLEMLGVRYTDEDHKRQNQELLKRIADYEANHKKDAAKIANANGKRGFAAIRPYANSFDLKTNKPAP